jgi:hypothetical protein
MRWIAVVLGLSALVFAGTAAARTTKDFLYRCSTDEAACAAKIKDVRRALEYPPPGRGAAKFCFPSGMSDEGLVGEVTYWIGEQMPSMDNQDENISIAAALTSLYSCTGVKGLEGDAE